MSRLTIAASLVVAAVGYGFWTIWPYRPADTIGWLALGAVAPGTLVLELLIDAMLTRRRSRGLSERRSSMKRIAYGIVILLLLAAFVFVAVYAPIDWDSHFVKWF